MSAKVKLLAWGPELKPNRETCSYDHCISSGGIFNYRIEWKSWKEWGDGYVVIRFYGDPDSRSGEDFVCSADDLASAKVAAQSDYDTLILSALEPTPSGCGPIGETE